MYNCLLYIVVYGCQIVYKELDGEKRLICSSVSLTGIMWLFNNQSELGPGVVVSQDGSFITIPPSEPNSIRSVYGDYSCFQNNTLLNCSRLFLTGKHKWHLVI